MYIDPTTPKPPITATGDAVGFLPARNSYGKPITVIGTEAIRNGFDAICLQQALNSRGAPGVTDLVLNPDAHAGYGAPVGSVLVSPTHIYPGPVGVDMKCSMSLLQFDLPVEEIADKKVRRKLIEEICQRLPTGAGRGQSSLKHGRKISVDLGKQAVIEGASASVCAQLGIPPRWADRCEDSFHVAHDGSAGTLGERLEWLLHAGVVKNFDIKVNQLGSYGGGNHFGECEAVEVADNDRARAVADVFGLRHGKTAFLSHCGSRGLGNVLASGQFKALQAMFARWDIPLPGGDKELVYAPLGTPEADAYLDDLALGANFATVNHMLINAMVLEAFESVFPGIKGDLVYFISHNIARQEIVDNRPAWVHRKGATRAFPGGHHALKGTPFEATGHPILLPGNPRDGSAVMVADAGAALSCYSVNHGAGRAMGRKEAIRRLDQGTIDSEMHEHDILSNCRQYPKDEAPAAYKDFNEVLKSVALAGLASEVARLKARFVIKDGDKADD
ncbi:RtcB family protein [Humisphaera borealis]|uniref:tRNA-splicing ligase RtcB n=1 Tax=Humisphaera borealis TaxID=2807512 RepID=A0A7M2WQ37_9BACT|nr:RtcB family protein [Humisphaera borealis]QOV87566.1 RtcB family protein [Humisphaera borealis]